MRHEHEDALGLFSKESRMTNAPTGSSNGASEPHGSSSVGTRNERDFSHEEEGYQEGLKPRHLQMIAIGGAIGTGLFLGAGGKLASVGPALLVLFAVCGFFAFLILRALGELVLHRSSSGSFVSYAREFYGEKLAYVAGWMYWLNWAFTAMADTTAVATYLHYWSGLKPVPQWLLALIVLVVVFCFNLVSVKLFGELEFWFAILKVAAIIAFLVVGVIFIVFSLHTSHGETGFGVWAHHGGFMPKGNSLTGVVSLAVLMSGVVFAYSAVELVGTAAGETKNPRGIMPRAVNSVVVRIVVFYCGSILLLSLLLPYTAYSKNESPFVTFFSSIGSKETGLIAGSVVQFILTTAAFSSLNAGLYSTGRILRSMAINGAAPGFTGKMNKQGVPWGGITLTAAFALIGIFVNLVLPEDAFTVVTNIASFGIVTGWAVIVICQIRLRKWVKEGKAVGSTFRLFGAPFTAYLTLAFLASVVILMAFDYPTGTWTFATLIVIVPALIIGWFVVRKRVAQVAQEREGYTGTFPVVAERPGIDYDRGKRGKTQK